MSQVIQNSGSDVVIVSIDSELGTEKMTYALVVYATEFTVKWAISNIYQTGLEHLSEMVCSKVICLKL